MICSSYNKQVLNSNQKNLENKGERAARQQHPWILIMFQVNGSKMSKSMKYSAMNILITE